MRKSEMGQMEMGEGMEGADRMTIQSKERKWKSRWYCLRQPKKSLDGQRREVIRKEHVKVNL